MAQPRVVHLPALRPTIWQALRLLTETTFAPTALFWVLVHLAGLSAAIVGALALNYALLGRRLLQRRSLPVLLVLGTALLTLRSVAAVALHSGFLYFAQSSVNAFVVAGAFGVSALLGRPLLGRLAGDFVALPAPLVESAGLARYFRRASLAWGLLNAFSGALSLWVLTQANVDTVLLFRGTIAPAITGAALLGLVVWGRAVVHGEGFVLRWRWSDKPVERPLAPAEHHLALPAAVPAAA